MIKWLLLFTLLLPSMAQAQKWSTKLDVEAPSPEIECKSVNTNGSKCHYTFNTQVNSNFITITTANAQFCLNPAINFTISLGATVMIQKCISGTSYSESTDPIIDCIDVLDTALDGVGGSSATQNACSEWMGPGTYRVLPVTPTGGPYARVTVTGRD